MDKQMKRLTQKVQRHTDGQIEQEINAFLI